MSAHCLFVLWTSFSSTDGSIDTIHSLEHIVEGITLSWSCAAEVANLAALSWRSAWTIMPSRPLST
jgi:hypothetical protein